MPDRITALLAPWRAGMARARIARRAALDTRRTDQTLGTGGRIGRLPGGGLSSGRGHDPQNQDKTL
jgi:hypothetical protein